jgi:cellulose synthase/poly-beta-1,6-N-acetylglucosamine synthase-like glycosyltransferase
LYHWRESPASVGFDIKAKAYAHENARRALRSHFERTKRIAEVVPGYFIFHRAVYPIPNPPPLVTLIVLAQGDVSASLNSLTQMARDTDYAPLELISICDRDQTTPAGKVLADIQNEPRVKVRQIESTSNSAAAINLAVREAQGEIVGVLSTNLKVVAPGWLAEMVSHALRPDIGVVGAKVYDSNDLIHHAGVILGIKEIAGMAHQGFQKESAGYLFRTQVTQNFSAVSGGCLLFRRDVFAEAGGFDETELPDLFRDIDLCLKIGEKGYRVLWTPYAELQETGPTPAPASPEVSTPADYLKSRWADALISDPYYNPNLSLEFEDFRLAFPPRREKLISNEGD